MLVVNAGVEHQAGGAEQFAREPAIFTVRIAVEAYLLAQPLGIERPAFYIGGVRGVLAKRRQGFHLLRDRDLHMVAGHALVVCSGLHIEHAAVREVAGIHVDLAGTRTVRRSRIVFGGRRFLFAVDLDRHHLHGRLRQQIEQLRQFGLHLVDVGAVGA